MNEVALPPISDPSIPLDPSLPPSSTLLQTFGEYLSQIDVTYDGLHYAFIKLDASKKEIQNIDALQQYLHLRIIDISENQINSLSPGLDVQNHLMYLNASKNKLTRLEHITFATKLGLKVLDLSNNELEEICQLTTWPSLLTLNLNSTCQS
ncbi:Leucine-rich repeat-containing protein 23 [Coelomomyces lativittatus]|nr:Leucine-rich repeat-containing protein 23 [Coelomomyces lativittatus]KAJ1513030.1 Leucine-rich repeat-containing protein 23 [Coelomomyces lativittatus]